MRASPASALAVVLITAASAGAGEVRVFLNGLYNVSPVDYSSSRTFTEFTEQGSLAVSYKAKAGPGVEGGFQYGFTRRLGAAVSFARVARDATATYSASLPHPLYLDRDRQAEGEASGLASSETAIHVDLVIRGGSGSLRYGAFAGPSFFQVKADVLDRVQYEHTYPYDTVRVTGTPVLEADDSPIGFNVGVSADYMLGSRAAVGAQARFSRASAKLAAGESGQVKVDVGGLDVGVGLRIYF
jgi:hypothetical protein